MRKILAACIICGGLSGCSGSGGSAESMAANMPQECKEMVQVWQTYITRLQEAPEIPAYYTHWIQQELDDYLRKLGKEPKERHASLCIPLRGLRQDQIVELENDRQTLLSNIERSRRFGLFRAFE